MRRAISLSNISQKNTPSQIIFHDLLSSRMFLYPAYSVRVYLSTLYKTV